MPDLNYELAPRQGQSASQRKQELDGARFIAIRNLAYMTYKKPDGSPLLSYAETLDDRERVKGMIIQHELALGLLVNDGGAVQPQPQPAMPAAQQPGVPQMAQQPVPVMQFQPAATPQQAAQVPQQQFQQQAPPQQQFQQPPMQTQQFQQPAPQMQPPPQQMQMQLPIQPAAPAQAAAAGEAAPTGRKRRGAGAAVAPPPAAPPPSGPVQQVYGAPPPQGQVMGQAPGQFNGQPQYPQQPAQVPQFQPQMQVPQFQPQQQAAPQFQPQPQAPMQQSQMAGGQPNAMTIDLSPVLQKLDLLGKGLEIAAGNSDAAMRAVADLKNDLGLILIALNHIYLSMPAPQGQQTLGQLTQGRANDLPGFRSHLSQYLPK